MPCYTHAHMWLGSALVLVSLSVSPPLGSHHRPCLFFLPSWEQSIFLLCFRERSPQPASIVPMRLWTVFPLPHTLPFHFWLPRSCFWVLPVFFFPHPLFQNPLSKCESLRISFLPADCWHERRIWWNHTPVYRELCFCSWGFCIVRSLVCLYTQETELFMYCTGGFWLPWGLGFESLTFWRLLSFGCPCPQSL